MYPKKLPENSVVILLNVDISRRCAVLLQGYRWHRCPSLHMIRLFLLCLPLCLSHSVLLQEEVGLDDYMINSDYTDKSQFKDTDSVIQQ